jgi:hypothetical protein
MSFALFSGQVRVLQRWRLRQGPHRQAHD